MNAKRLIMHVDMDAFFASVEQGDQPHLRGQPVAVGGSSHRGVVAAASYEARQFGVYSAMPATQARRLCPQLVFVPARFERYQEVSAQVFGIFQRYSDLIEGLSLDEAFLDISGSDPDPAALLEMAQRLKREISHETGLTASVGIAHNKLLAKLASDYDKPDGLVIVPAGDVQRFLDPLPVKRLWGIGKRMTARLHHMGIFTIGQLRKAPLDILDKLFGQQARVLALRAAGIDDRPVKTARTRRSISQEKTFDEDQTDAEALIAIIRRQARRLADKLKEKDLYARTVVLKLRSSSFSTITRSRSLPQLTRRTSTIEQTAVEMFLHWAEWHPGFAVRLVGVGVGSLGRPQVSDQLL